MTHSLYGEIATALTIIAYVPYIISILHHKTRPNRTTWLALSIIGTISFFTYRSLGAEATLGVALANLVGPVIVFLFTLRFGEGWDRLNDFKYLGLSCIAIIFWQTFSFPLMGLIFNLLADFVAFLPTIEKSIKAPWTEDTLTWVLFVSGGILNLFAIEKWTFSIIVYPLYIVLAEGFVAILLTVRLLTHRRTTS